MADTPYYNQNGTLTGIFRVELDGSNSFYPFTSNEFKDYVAANAPPQTSAPSFKPTRIPLPYITTYNQIQALYASTPLVALHYLMAWVAYQAVNNPTVAADINAKLGTSIGFDQVNP